MTKNKRCFLISPIGNPGSETRHFADMLKEFLHYEVLDPLGYLTQRADDINRAGTITEDIIREIADSDLAIAVLDYDNPNVYYELALRHVTYKICILIVSDEYSAGNELPFDIKQERVFSFSREDLFRYRSNIQMPRDLHRFKDKLISAIEDYRNNEYNDTNPVALASHKIVLPKNVTIDDAREYVQTSIDGINDNFKNRMDSLQASIAEKFNNLSTLMQDWMPEDLKSAVRDMYQNGSATYISGEENAFGKLTEMTKTAKRSLRTTRFAPQAISMSHNDFYKSVCSFGKRDGVTCKRIMCVNDSAKVQDIIKIIMDTAGGSMQLYLTDRDNNFELVVIDDTCAFLHFYDEHRFIRSTLFIRGQAVVLEFAAIYDRLIESADQKITHIDCGRYNNEDFFTITNDVQRIISSYGL